MPRVCLSLVLLVYVVQLSRASLRLYVGGEFSISGSTPHEFGTIDLESNTSVRSLALTHAFSDADLPNQRNAYCGPVFFGDDNGTIWDFAGSGCVENDGFAPPRVLGRHVPTQTTTVYDSIPSTAEAHGSPWGPQFVGSQIWRDTQFGNFYMLASGPVAYHSYDLSVLYEFDPATGSIASLVEFGFGKNAVGGLYDQPSGKLFVAVDDVYSDGNKHKTYVIDGATGATSVQEWDALRSLSFSQYDPATNTTLHLNNGNAVGGDSTTPYTGGSVQCTDDGCEFSNVLGFRHLWSADRVTQAAYDASQRILSVQSSGCYNLTTMDFNCVNNLNTDKFLQYRIPDPLPSTVTELEPEYYSAGVSNDDDDQGFNWRGVAYVGV